MLVKLDEIALEKGTDKSSKHLGYTKFYEKEFYPLRTKKLNILELGIYQGASLSLWKDYFLNANILGVDIQNLITDNFKNIFDERCFLEIGSQDDTTFLEKINSMYGAFNIIIDDASHLASKTIKSFEYLFPLLKKGGIYVIEDLGVFYPNSEKGDYFKDLGNDRTTINFLKELIDIIHNEWFLNYQKKGTSDYFKSIEKITFYNCICFIHKK